MHLKRFTFPLSALLLLLLAACSNVPPESTAGDGSAQVITPTDDGFLPTSTPMQNSESETASSDQAESVTADNDSGEAVEQNGDVVVDGTGLTETYNGLTVGFTADGNAYVGDLNAPVVIEEYSDYQCPFCSRFALTTMRDLKQGAVANGEAVLIFYDFPLNIHPQAPAASNAARCAGEAGPAAYWAMHDALFEDVRGWSINNPSDVLIEMGNGLDIELTDDFPNCVTEMRYQSAIDADFNRGRENGVQSTPTFFMNGQPLIGAQPIASFERAIAALSAGESIVQDSGPQIEELDIPPFQMPEQAVFGDEYAGEMGDPDAPILIVEFTDYQCPFCSRHVAETMPTIISELIDTGRVRYVLKDFPLDSIHPEARAAAAAARCAGEQDAYWEMHDSVFANQAAWGQGGMTPEGLNQVLSGFAATLGLDTIAFDSCMADGRYDEAVEANLQEGLGEEITGTPTFFIDGYYLSGAQPFEVFELVVENIENETIEDLFRESYEAQVEQYKQQLAQQQQQQQAPPPPTGPVDVNIEGDPFLGDPDAPITIIEFTDFQCPFCVRHFENTFPLIKANYIDQGLVKYVYKEFPLSFHPEADEASEAARCANDQGEYFSMHDKLFETQPEWGSNPEFINLFIGYAEELGLDKDVFADCLNSGKYTELVQNQLREGQQLGISGTPTFFINGNIFVGAQPISSFATAIDSLLNSE